MIEKLIDPEHFYGKPEYNRLSEQIFQIKQQLCNQLDQEGREKLEQLTDLFMRQENAALYDAFEDGFWTAVELMLEFQQHKRK